MEIFVCIYIFRRKFFSAIQFRSEFVIKLSGHKKDGKSQLARNSPAAVGKVMDFEDYRHGTILDDIENFAVLIAL